MNSGEPTAKSGSSRAALLALGLFVIGLALRLAAGHNPLWLDEIWSVELARQASSVYEIFTRFRVDNNHLLNTLWLYSIGPADVWILYRLPSW